MKLIVGLGNPGKQYEHTRHNVGFDVLYIIGKKLDIKFKKVRHKAHIGEAIVSGEKIVLAKPQTYMNLSGQSLEELSNWYKIDLDKILVIYDDIDLPLGKIRIRGKGGAGTHKGMKSIIKHLKTEDFPRIRVGIGNPPPEWDLSDWVLSSYNSSEEREIAFSAYKLAADAAIDFALGDIEKVMQKYNNKI